MKRLKGILLIVSLTAILALVFLWSLRTHSKPAAANSCPPVDQLHAFAATNAPRTAGGSWSNDSLADPLKSKIIQQVAAKVLAGQSNNPPSTDKGIAGSFRDAKQVDALRQLQSRTGASLQVYLRSENCAPNQLKGWPLAKAVSGGGDRDLWNESTAKAFLRENAALLLLDNPDGELRLANRSADDLGGSVLRFTQHYQGLMVWPAEIGVHLNAEGDVDLVDCAYIPTPSEVTVQPKLTGTDAEMKARGVVTGGADATIGTPELVIYAPLDRSAKLAWKMDVSAGLTQAWWVLIDAQNGETLTKISRIMDGSVSGSGTDLLGVTRPLMVWQEGSTYYMIDASKPMFNGTTGNGYIEINDARGTNIAVLQTSYFVTSSLANSWGNPDAVSASYNLSQTYDYYQSRFNRDSYNGLGSNLTSIVRIGSWANACWNGELKIMLFGNADRYAGSLDIVGHEVTHGVVGSIGSQGVLVYQNQPGALNEAFADIFGEMIEARTKGTNDWLLGSQMTSVFRSMASPTNYGQPAIMSKFVVTTDDHGGVHINNSIINRAYYLLAVGLKDAVGRQDAERIFYRCLTISMKPYSQFIDARLGCIAAAEALFGVGSTQALKTAEAFDVVELYAAPASAPQPTNVNAAVSAADSFMFIREHWFYTRDDLFRFEAAKGDSGSGRSLKTAVKVSRPTISGDGSEMCFVGSNEDIYYIETGGAGLTNFNWAGVVHSVAVSPQGQYLAFVFNAAPGVPTNQIVIVDLWADLMTTETLMTPVSDGPPLNNISYADQLSFSPDGKLLIYDALSQMRGADGQLRRAWSIFGLDMETLQQHVVVPAEDQFNMGNPSFSRTSSRFVVFDAQYTNGNTAVVTLDLYQGTLGAIGVSYNGLGYPVFNGDDTKVFFADQDSSTSSGRSIYVQPLSADKMSVLGGRTLAISDAKLAVIYRRGTYPSINTAPEVLLTSPAPNAEFTSPATVTISASAGDIGGSVARVEFYNSDKLLFSDVTAPYSVVCSNMSAGVYTVYARVYDNQDASATTAPLRFTVMPSGQAGVMNRPGVSGFEHALKLPKPGLYRLEASTNLVDWVSLGTFYGTTNLGFLDSRATNFPVRFYRAVLTP